MARKLVAAVACRNQGSRLYGKPLQNLDVSSGFRVLDNIIDCLLSIDCLDAVVLGISEGVENEVFKSLASDKRLEYVVGDERDVLSRLILCGRIAQATDIFRITSESPFLFFEPVAEIWQLHQKENADATFMDHIIDGCGFEILTLKALEFSHEYGEPRHCSELCTLYIREHPEIFKIVKGQPPEQLIRKDLRLTVDNPEDLVVCRSVFHKFKHLAPRIPLLDVVRFLDENPKLVELIAPFTEFGYQTMYRDGHNGQ